MRTVHPDSELPLADEVNRRDSRLLKMLKMLYNGLQSISKWPCVGLQAMEVENMTPLKTFAIENDTLLRPVGSGLAEACIDAQ